MAVGNCKWEISEKSGKSLICWVWDFVVADPEWSVLVLEVRASTLLGPETARFRDDGWWSGVDSNSRFRF